jgi:hypothetical protein
MANCPKLEKQRMKVLTSNGRDQVPDFLQRPEDEIHL